ncbi:farnesyl pyrophosphate synthase-like isoform X2 [Artemia franciscana]|uniref:farnesyl pyrophosphate synthase-like isoform X2 n=1 Tax=Artemia franciscana TaxID=6661 RepID=UPI0032DBAD47
MSSMLKPVVLSMQGLKRCLVTSSKLILPVSSGDKKSDSTSKSCPNPENLEDGFHKFFPNVISQIIKHSRCQNIPDVAKWINTVFETNCSGGKMRRGMTILESLLILKDGKIDQDELQDAFLVAWAAEMMQSFILIMDDYMDQSETRRGKPCWYKTGNLGPKAMNDAFLMESSIYELFYHSLSSKPFYKEILHLFKDSGIKNKTAFEAAWNIALPLGIYFQEQDDYLDLYGDPNVTGKVGSDIRFGKCTWFAVQVMKTGKKHQIKLLKDFYGSKQEESIQKIKKLYEEMNLQNVFHNHALERSEEFNSKLNKLPNSVPTIIFHNIINSIVNRNK